MNRLRFVPPLGVIAIVGPAMFAIWLRVPLEDTDVVLAKDTQHIESASENSVEDRLLDPIEIAAIDPVFQERPLFIEGRRVPVIKETPIEPLPVVVASEPVIEAPAPPPPPLPPEIELAGIVLDAAGGRALIRNLMDGSEIWMTEGQPVGEWTLAEISQEEVRLVAGGIEIAFKLFPDALP